MALDDMREERGADDSAEAAFDRLRDELLAGQDSVFSELKRLDCSETLGVIVQRLRAIEGHPALRMTPEGFGQAMRAASEAVEKRAEQKLYGPIQGLDAVARDLKGRLAGARALHNQNRLLAVAAAAGMAVGAGLWAGLSGPLARALPASWAAPEKMAAATLGLGGWNAGQRLMRWANPLGFQLAVQGDQVARANREALAKCEAVVQLSGQAQRCVLVVPPDGTNGP
ncbi:MAG: DUF6118 family protein [Caulobacteraceae bacterium]